MTQPPPTKKQRIVNGKDIQPLQQNANYLKDLRIFVVEKSVGKTRSAIFRDHITKHGGFVEKTLSPETSYVLVDKSIKMQTLMKYLKVRSLPIEDEKILNVDWLSQCLVAGRHVDISIFQIFKPAIIENTSEDEECHSPKRTTEEKHENEKSCKVAEETSKDESSYEQLMALKNERQASSDYSDSDEEDLSHKQGFVEGLVSTEMPSGKWVCAKPSPSKQTNHNEMITNKLEVLQKTYENTKDKWRALSYKKAIQTIRNHHKVLETYEEVKALPSIGDRLADKIWEIIETGHLRRLDHMDEKSELINTFAAVWGAGPSTAKLWVAQGHKSLEDLQNKANLTFQQKIGLKHYDDINEKMPREEVAEIENHIREVAESVLPGVHMQVCGSYRRGRPKCGDIDVLFSHPDNNLRKSFLKSVLDQLKVTGLITDDLVCIENREQRKYMGVCKLPRKGSKYRRIDFIVCPFNEWPLALLHFTGSAHFNRSIRLLAKKKNMSLSEHTLRKDVVRVGGEKMYKGTVLPVSSEEDVFKYFGLDFLKPTERDW